MHVRIVNDLTLLYQEILIVELMDRIRQRQYARLMSILAVSLPAIGLIQHRGIRLSHLKKITEAAPLSDLTTLITTMATVIILLPEIHPIVPVNTSAKALNVIKALLPNAANVILVMPLLMSLVHLSASLIMIVGMIHMLRQYSTVKMMMTCAQLK